VRYDGANLARKRDVVCVNRQSPAQRVGFLDLSSSAAPNLRLGNVGMLDIVAALEWVPTTSRLCGDPGNVTVFGESGAAAKVSTLMRCRRPRAVSSCDRPEAVWPARHDRPTPRPRPHRALLGQLGVGLAI